VSFQLCYDFQRFRLRARAGGSPGCPAGQFTTFIFMTLLIRLVTAMVLFVFFFVVVYFGICIVGGAFSGAFAGAGNTNPQDAYETGRQAGANFVRHNLKTILLSSFLISFVGSIALSFSGILPWCRKPAGPPPLPSQPPPLP
jgi:hypothetical protein